MFFARRERGCDSVTYQLRTHATWFWDTRRTDMRSKPLNENKSVVSCEQIAAGRTQYISVSSLPLWLDHVRPAPRSTSDLSALP